MMKPIGNDPLILRWQENSPPKNEEKISPAKNSHQTEEKVTHAAHILHEARPVYRPQPAVQTNELCLSSILPPKKKKTKCDTASEIKAAKEYLLPVKATLDVLAVLRENDFPKFYALVKENFCQERAVEVFDSYEEVFGRLLTKENDIKKIKTTIEKFIENKEKNKPKERPGLLFSDLLDAKLDILLTKKELYFLKCYILTLIRSTGKREHETDTKKLVYYAGVGRDFADDLANKLSLELAAESIENVRRHASGSGNLHALQMVSPLNIIHNPKNKMPYLSYFYGTDILVNQIKHKKMPIVVWVKQVAIEDKKNFRDLCHLFVSTNKGDYMVKTPTLEDANKAVIVFEGEQRRRRAELPGAYESKYEIESINPLEILSAHAAVHRQNPLGIVPDALKEDERYLTYKKKGEQWGCMRDGNAQLLDGKHIYVNTIGRIPYFNNLLNHSLQKYEGFYRFWAIKSIEDWLEVHYKNAELQIHEERIHIKNLSATGEQAHKIMQGLNAGYFVMFKVTGVTSPSPSEVRAIFTLDKSLSGKNWEHVDFIKLAKRHPSPVEFLVDHQNLWSFQVNKIIKFLLLEENLSNNRTVDCLIGMALNTEKAWDSEIQLQAIYGLGKALLTNPDKDKIKSILLYLAAPAPALRISVDLAAREASLKQLKPIIDEPDVRAELKNYEETAKQYGEYNTYQSYLDGKVKQEDELEKEILERVMQSSLRRSKKITAIEYYLKTSKPFSYKGFEKIEKLFVANIVQSGLSSKRVAPSTVEPLLKFLKKNSSDPVIHAYVSNFFEAYPKKAKTPFPVFFRWIKVMHYLSGSGREEWQTAELTALLSIMNAENLNTDLQILAIRHFTKFYLHRMPRSQLMIGDTSFIENFAVIHKIKKRLEKLSQEPIGHSEIKNEAASALQELKKNQAENLNSKIKGLQSILVDLKSNEQCDEIKGWAVYTYINTYKHLWGKQKKLANFPEVRHLLQAIRAELFLLAQEKEAAKNAREDAPISSRMRLRKEAFQALEEFASVQDLNEMKPARPATALEALF